MMFNEVAYREHLDSQPSSLTELIRDQMSFEGAQVPEQAWILSDFDTWERNPHYTGPANPPHPLDDDSASGESRPAMVITDEQWDADAADRNAVWEAAMLGGTADDEILF